MEGTWRPEPQLLGHLTAAVPEILGSQKENGQFGTEPWISTDQNLLLPLAAAWSLEESPYHHSEEVLDGIVRGGYALIEEQDAEGKWLFRKKDYSEWGRRYMPWVYSRWARAYQLVREAMPAEARKRWEQGLLLGHEGIARTCLDWVHNVPTHFAMGLYCAGQVFQRQDWKDQASDFLAQVADAQSPHGWWSEHHGPVVGYNFVYSDALGTYYVLSGDERVLPALERAARFHASYVYPDGSLVETVDERNPYHPGVRLGNPGFAHTPAGRGFLRQQHALYLEQGGRFEADYAGSMLLYGAQGGIEETAAGRAQHVHRMGDEALIWRQKPWFLSLSAYVCPPPQNRWFQDRQNLLSVFHDQVGLIAGGGNTKLQPLWSTFTVGDTALLKHTRGQEEPEFQPPEGLIHVPGRAVICQEPDGVGLELEYGGAKRRMQLEPQGESRLLLSYEAGAHSRMPVEAHLPLIPRLDQPLRLSSGGQVRLGPEPFEWSGEWVEHAGWRLRLPTEARLLWPALPHNPYRKGGEAEIEEARLVAALPFSREVSRLSVLLEII